MADENELQLSIKEIAKYLKQRTDELDGKIEELRRHVDAKHSSFPSDDAYSGTVTELEARLKKDVERVEDMVNSGMNKLVEKDLKKYVDTISDLRNELKKEMAEMKRDVSSQLNYTEAKINDMKHELKEISPSDIDSKFRNIESKLADVHHAKARVNEMEESLMGLKSAMSSKALSHKGDADSKALIDAHVKRMDEMERKLGETHKAMNRGTDSVMLSKLRGEISEQMEKFMQETDAKLKHIEESVASQGHGKDKHPHIDEKALIKTVKDDMINEYKKVEALQKEVEELRKHVEEAAKHAPTEHVNEHGHSRLEKSDGIGQIEKEIAEMRRLLEEEAVMRLSTDKAVQDIEQKVNRMEAHAERPKHIEIPDMTAAARANIRQHTDDSIKMEALKIVTKHMQEFSRTLDKKLPNLATKDEVAAIEAKFEERVEKKIRSLRPLNADPMLARRMEAIEKGMSEIMRYLKSISSTHTYIVE